MAGLETLREYWDAALTPTRGLVEGVRLVKSAEEVEAIREAQALADRVFGEVRPMIRAGVRELDVALARVTQTPTFFVNGKPLPSFGPQQLVDLVNSEVAKARSARAGS